MYWLPPKPFDLETNLSIPDCLDIARISNGSSLHKKLYKMSLQPTGFELKKCSRLEEKVNLGNLADGLLMPGQELWTELLLAKLFKAKVELDQGPNGKTKISIHIQQSGLTIFCFAILLSLISSFIFLSLELPFLWLLIIGLLLILISYLLYVLSLNASVKNLKVYLLDLLQARACSF